MANILIGGGTGFVGRFLSQKLREKGHHVTHLSRTERIDAEFPAYHWDIPKGIIDKTAVAQADYVINLAGAGVADGRWTATRKKIIIDSRVESTKLLAKTFKELGHQPKLYLSAAATGFYGNQGEQLQTEDDSPGDGFLSESCILWEKSVEAVADQGIPVFVNRTGIVLHPGGGALEKMLIPLNFYISGYFGSGQQWYSWIHMEDMVNTYVYAIEKQLTGAYNCVAPNPARNKELAAALPKAMNKNALLMPVPTFAIKLVFGEMSHTILDSCKVSADKLIDSGFSFKYPELMPALKSLL